MSMITAVSWVPRGHASQFPTKYVFDDEEYERIAKLAKLELDDAKEDLETARANEETKEEDEKQTNGHNGTKKASKEHDRDSDM